jgi:LysM repeat protein
MKSFIRTGCLLVLVLTLAWPMGGAAAAPQAADGPNLLQNPGFESPYAKQCCHTVGNFPADLLIDEVQVAAGWRGWWLEPDQDPIHQGACNTPGCTAWHRPEFREANCGPVCANRIRSGSNAQKYFTFFSVHDGGMYQQVGGIAPGARVRFSVYMQGWSASDDSGLSNRPSPLNMRVGIDPFGGDNPYSPNIIWAAPFDTYDAWGLYQVEAVARAGTVTVFTRSSPTYGVNHNDLYVDDASLVVVGGGAPANSPAASSPTGFSYVVQVGDNYYRIARRFGVTVQSIYDANHITNPNLLAEGAVLIIPGVSGPASMAPTPTQAAPAGAITYVVVAGDNFYRLARRFNTTVERIKQLNGLTADILYIGQVLIIAP